MSWCDPLHHIIHMANTFDLDCRSPPGKILKRVDIASWDKALHIVFVLYVVQTGSFIPNDVVMGERGRCNLLYIICIASDEYPSKYSFRRIFTLSNIVIIYLGRILMRILREYVYQACVKYYHPIHALL